VLEVVNFWNKMYLSAVAPKISVFKLDKTATSVDTLYVEEQHSRIYLPPFEIRAMMLTNPWRQLLGYEAIKEEEDNIQFVVNFEDMVQRVRALSGGHITDMYITYDGDSTDIPAAAKTGSSFVVRKNGSVLATYDLTTTDYNTTKKLGTAINTIDDFSVTLQGRNDSSVNLVDFANSTFQGATLNVYSLDHTYDNITDVIEYGDLIMSNKWRLYEVMNANPSGDFGWDFVQYTLSCNLARMDQVSLPGDYEEQIIEHQYGIKDRISME